jgi:hypothetical protein
VDDAEQARGAPEDNVKFGGSVSQRTFGVGKDCASTILNVIYVCRAEAQVYANICDGGRDASPAV